MTTIVLQDELERILSDQARLQGKTVEEVVVDTLRERFVQRPRREPRDEWERRLRAIASDCGPGLSDYDVSSEGIYD